MDNLLKSLSVVINRYSEEDAVAKLSLLNKLKSVSRFNTKQLVSYHDCLLYLLAYPDNKIIYSLASAELDRLTAVISNYTENKKIALSGTGLPHTITICSYSFELSKWLSNNFANDADIESSSANKIDIRETLRLFFPQPEYWQTTQDEMSVERRINLLKSRKDKRNNLSWLVQQFSNIENSSLMEEYLFSNLKLFIKWKMRKEDSRSYIRGLSLPIYYHSDLIKRCDPKKIIDKALPKPKKLNEREKLHLCNTAKASLALLYRETDPITYSDYEEVVYFELERGISIALYGMKKDKRFSMESYVGYMAFKNGLPMAYGGGWMLGSRCKIGVNIYEPYRGGESAFVFTQIIRTYRQYYGMERFVVKPYQFGKGNPDGIKSGAYWFYYKLGFRSAEKEIAVVAKNEWEKIANEKNYRSPEKVLKSLTGCNVELILNEASLPQYDGSAISIAITQMINDSYNGDRRKAQFESMRFIKRALLMKKKLTNIQLLHLSQLCLWFALIPGLDKWSDIDKNKLRELILLKSADDERKYVLKLKEHKKLWRCMQSVIYP